MPSSNGSMPCRIVKADMSAPPAKRTNRSFMGLTADRHEVERLVERAVAELEIVQLDRGRRGRGLSALAPELRVVSPLAGAARHEAAQPERIAPEELVEALSL